MWYLKFQGVGPPLLISPFVIFHALSSSSSSSSSFHVSKVWLRFAPQPPNIRHFRMVGKVPIPTETRQRSHDTLQDRRVSDGQIGVEPKANIRRDEKNLNCTILRLSRSGFGDFDFSALALRSIKHSFQSIRLPPTTVTIPRSGINQQISCSQC
jgi:hypothetical protein